MRTLLALTLLSTAFALPLAGSANAQAYSDALMKQCSEAAGQFKFEGYPSERNRDLMTKACLANGGTIPGAAVEKPVSLPRRALHQR